MNEELPTAAVCDFDKYHDGQIDWVLEGDMNVGHGDELVRLEDARKQRQNVAFKAYTLGKKDARKGVLELMDQIASDNWGGKQEATKQDWKNAWQTLCKELKEEADNE